MLKKHILQNKMYLSLITIMMLGTMLGYILGYHAATGVFPNIPFTEPRTSMPPGIELSSQTFDDVNDFIAEDTTNDEQYGDGMNCVDFALVVARNAQWMGLGAEIVKLDFNSGYSHTLLLFPTSDAGLIAVDPQTDKSIALPTIGEKYNGKTITGIYILGYQWIPIEQFLEGGGNNGE